MGIGARSSDSVAVKTAKYAIDKGVPIVGGAVSGTVDTRAEGASLIKNSAGLAALVTLLLVVLRRLQAWPATPFAPAARRRCAPHLAMRA